MHPQGWSMQSAQLMRPLQQEAIAETPMMEGFMARHIGGTALAFTAALLAAGCGPVYLSDTYATSTPGPGSFKVHALAGEPVATLGVVAPASLQGLSPTLSLALAAALAEVSPPIREIPDLRDGKSAQRSGFRGRICRSAHRLRTQWGLGASEAAADRIRT